MRKCHFRLRPIGTLTGSFDASRVVEINVDVYTNEIAFSPWEMQNYPRVRGQLVLVDVEDQGLGPGKQGYRVDGIAGGIPITWKDPNSSAPASWLWTSMVVVPRLDDIKFDEPLRNIQWVRGELRKEAREHPVPGEIPPRRTWTSAGPAEPYWQAHAVIYALVIDVVEGKAVGSPTTLILRPKLTLAGALDVGLTPEVSAKINLKDLGPPTRPRAGEKVVVFLERQGSPNSDKPTRRNPGKHVMVSPEQQGDVYRVAEEQAPFMPESERRRAPIFRVKDFSDPRVEQTIKALKVARKAPLTSGGVTRGQESRSERKN